VITVARAEQLADHVGHELGVSDWISLSEQDIERFASVTRDRHWVHTDPERAARQTPFGGVIAHGFLVLALVTDLFGQCLDVRAATRWLNYGLDRVRFTAPVRPGDALRLRLGLAALELGAPSSRLDLDCTLELEGGDRPALVARWIAVAVEETP
jgi:acyl dehydratase